jgi:16S rRNA G966 N2-methylase RsmD
MKIIAGKYGGRHFVFNESKGTHPMSEKIRGAIYNRLGDLAGLSVLDAYAGSGAVGFEALSRGAASVMMIENNPRVAAQIYKSIDTLELNSPRLKVKRKKDKERGIVNSNNTDKLETEGEPTIKLRKQSIATYSRSNQDKYDVIIVDPPHDRMDYAMISKLKKHLKDTSTMVLCYPGREQTPVLDGIVVVDNRNYGDASVAFYSLG